MSSTPPTKQEEVLALIKGDGGEHKWHDYNRRLHRNGDLPAYIGPDGAQHWFQNGILHRDGDKPAVLKPDGTQEWWQDGARHRDGDEPAWIMPDGSRRWYQRGKLHRVDGGPSVVWTGGDRAWYQDDLMHRGGDLPALVRNDGTKMWYWEGKRHRDGDQPAVVRADGTREWWRNNQQHRDGNPAVIEANGDQKWYHHGTLVDPPPPVVAPASPPNAEEQQYLDLVREVIEHGARRPDRTGTGTRSKFGAQMRFSLRDGAFPLLTTKRVWWRGVAEELLWFVSGSTNGNLLRAKDVNFWNENGSRAFLDARGLAHREEGDLGPVYGFQWRHFGAKYTDMHADYAGQGVDQLRACIDKLKTSPEDRRIVLSAWNPPDLDAMALPPCHLLCQFYVADGALSCQMYQRSADLGLGVPFNIASYALLTALVARSANLQCGHLVITIGDAHVYETHVEALQTQLERTPRAFPRLRIDGAVADIDECTFAHLSLEGYAPDAAVPMKMAV